MAYSNKETLKLMATKNWRGVGNSYLVYEILNTRAKLDLLEISSDKAIGVQRPSICTEDEWIESHRYFWNCVIASAVKELQHRRHINAKGIKNPDREIIQVIKDDMPIADVLEWYTEVFYASRDQWRFRCTLHGEDKNPSGVIYTKEQRWWCFGCNKGGDVLDAVQLFERVDLPQAIKKLATHLGIELRPLIHKPIPHTRGGAII